MKLIRDILSDKSDISSMRVMSILALLLAGYIAIRGLETHADLSGLSMLCGAFVSAAFAGKVFQKNIEVKESAKRIEVSSQSQS